MGVKCSGTSMLRPAGRPNTEHAGHRPCAREAKAVELGRWPFACSTMQAGSPAGVVRRRHPSCAGGWRF